MDDLNLLTKALTALDDKLAACMKCGMCQRSEEHTSELQSQR